MYSLKFPSSIRCFAVLLVVVFTTMSINAGTIIGRVINASDTTAMGQCTVKLSQASDGKFVTGTATDDNGKFRLNNVKNGNYLLTLSFIGYNEIKQDVSITAAKPNVNLGTLTMKENSIMLKETVVTASKTDVVVKEDTIEFNADSYHTQPNSVVEDLLKRLPGVEVSSDGTITSQGKTVKKILVDGKEFFSDDPQIATKNLPVDIIDKLQVVDRKSDLARLTGVDDGEEETVINLTIKKGMNNGWFGSGTVGYGTDDRYGTSFIVNRFWDGNQITFIGNANNTNNQGFTDGNAGNFGRYGRMNGIRTTQSFGMNFNVGKGEQFRVGGNLFYSHSDNEAASHQSRTYLFTDSTSYYKSASIGNDKSHNVRGDFRMHWEIDSANTLEFMPRFSLNYVSSMQLDSSSTRAGDGRLVNYSLDNDYNKGNTYSVSGNLIYNHKFLSHKGCSFSINANYNIRNTTEKTNSFAFNRYYLLDSIDNMPQYIDNHTWSSNVGGRITWTEPLGDISKAMFLTLGYNFTYRWNNADKWVYDLPATTSNPYLSAPTLISSELVDMLAQSYGPVVYNDDNILNDILMSEIAQTDMEYNKEQSNRFRNDFFTQRIQIGFKKVHQMYNLDLGFNLNPSRSSSKNLTNPDKSIPTHTVWNFAPYLRFRYKFDKTTTLQANYRANSSEPSIRQLQPIPDVSNPLRIVVGNPNLKPTFSNYINIRYNSFNREAQRSIMAMCNVSFTSNSIVSKTSYNSETGGQITTYENVNGVWNMNLANMINMPLGKSHWQFSNHIFARANQNKGFTIVKQETQERTSTSMSFNESMGITYRLDNLDLEFRPNYGLQYSHYSVGKASNPLVHNYGAMFYGNWSLPFGLVFNTNVRFSATKGYAAGYDKNQWNWDAKISYQFLRGRVATLSLAAYDILNQRQSISRNVTANYIQDSDSRTLARYFMLSFAFKFNTFAGGKSPQGKGMGPGGPGGPGGWGGGRGRF